MSTSRLTSRYWRRGVIFLGLPWLGGLACSSRGSSTNSQSSAGASGALNATGGTTSNAGGATSAAGTSSGGVSAAGTGGVSGARTSGVSTAGTGPSTAGTGSGGTAGSGQTPAATVGTVHYGTTRQVIDGFGTATAWGTIPPDATLDAFFSVSKGAGLTILRNRIPFREAPANNDNFMGGGNYTFTTTGSGTAAYKTFTLNWDNWDLSALRALIDKLRKNADYAVSSYFSTPWTPPNNGTSKWKLGVADYSNAPEIGGYLDPNHYQDYADVLADYALGFETSMGVPLTALSLQNEPNFKASYESADWSAAQFHDFLVVLKAEFTKKGVLTTLPKLAILAPEDPNFKEALILPTLADPSTASLIGIVGAHQYEFGPQNVDSYVPPPLTQSVAAGKKIWMTEWNLGAFTSATPIGAGLILAGLIHADITGVNLNAYVHWWYKDLVDSAGAPNKNLWALAQFSRFIRPGWSRVDATAKVAPGVLLSAYRDPASAKLVAVAVNKGLVPVTFALELDAGMLGDVTSYRTSATEDLVAAATYPGGASFVNVTLPAQSVTTLLAPVSH